MRDVLPSFCEYLAARFRPRTASTYLAHVEAFIAFRGSSAHAEPAVTEIESFLARRRRDGAIRAATSRNQALSALRALAAFGERELGWRSKPTDGVSFAVEPPRDPPVLDVAELRLLFATAATIARPRERARDLAILGLLSQAALRVHELVALDVDQIDVTTATLLQVRGKGGTMHDVPLSAGTVALVRAWLEERMIRVQSNERALFVAGSNRRISVRAIQQLFVRLRHAMGTSKRLTPHTMRHSAATITLALGTDVVIVAALLRHSDLNSTRRYIHLIDTQRREAVRRLATTIPAELLAATPSPITPTETVAEQPTPNATAATESGKTSAADPPCAHHDMGATSSPRTL